MTREEVLKCLNTGSITENLIREWAERRANGELSPDKINWVVSQIINQIHFFGGLNPTIIEDILKHYQINQLLDKSGNHITYL